MQDCLTHFLSGFELGAFSYFSIAFIWFAFNRSQVTPAAAPTATPAAVGALDTAKLANGFPPFEALGTAMVES